MGYFCFTSLTTSLQLLDEMAASSTYDRDFLTRLAAGDAGAFDVLFRRYYDPLFSAAFVYVKVRAMAEDIVQQVFLKLWEKRERLTAVENLEGYLFMAARNEILNCLRQQAVRRNYANLVKEMFREECDGPEAYLVAKQYGEIVQRAIGNLPPQQQRAWRLSREKGLCYDEIAQQMGIAIPTVKSHISGALKSIRGTLAVYQGDLLFPLLALVLLRP
jgi:RNA polymerase sigma-70 factor (family 1)